MIDMVKMSQKLLVNLLQFYPILRGQGFQEMILQEFKRNMIFNNYELL